MAIRPRVNSQLDLGSDLRLDLGSHCDHLLTEDLGWSKTLPDTTDPEIDSVTWTKFSDQMAPLAIIEQFGHQMSPLELVPN